MDAKKCFEKHLKKSISDRSWYRIKALMVDNNLAITKANLEVVARLKTEAAKHKIPLAVAIEFYIKTAQLDATSIKGEDLYQYIQSLTNYKPHRTTICRWFPKYQPDKTYTASEISKVLLSAFIYKLRNANNGYHQKSARSSSLSTQKDWAKCF